jgi:hypothetical protein
MLTPRTLWRHLPSRTALHYPLAQVAIGRLLSRCQHVSELTFLLKILQVCGSSGVFLFLAPPPPHSPPPPKVPHVSSLRPWQGGGLAVGVSEKSIVTALAHGLIASAGGTCGIAWQRRPVTQR